MITFLTIDSQFSDVFHGLTLNTRQTLCLGRKIIPLCLFSLERFGVEDLT